MPGPESDASEVDVSSRRTLILVGAIAVGAIAAFLILRYVGSVEDRANSDGQQVSVLVVKAQIARGEKADDAFAAGKVEMGSRRRADLPLNAVTRPEDVRGMVAAIDMSPGEVVTVSKFVSETNLSDSNSSMLDTGKVAITVTVDSSTVDNLIKPGDFVNLMFKADTPPAAENATPAASETRVSYLFQKVKVLAIGQSFGSPVAATPATPGAPPTTAAPATGPVTLEVPPEAAPLIAAAADKSLRLTLVRPDYQPRPLPDGVITPGQATPGASGLTPYDGMPAGAVGAGQ